MLHLAKVSHVHIADDVEFHLLARGDFLYCPVTVLCDLLQGDVFAISGGQNVTFLEIFDI